MDANLAQSIEIETIAELLPELNYYEILQVDILAPTTVLERAYRSEARRLHPDRYARNPNGEVKRKANQIYRAVMEAWQTLKEPESREAYDQDLEDGHRRMSQEAKKQAEATAAAAANPIHAAKTDKGMKFWRMALRNWHDGEFSGAAMNIQFALNFEPENETFKAWLEKTKTAHQEVAAERHNPYKLRII
jgi:curved DNA-binding protein CbpA